MNAGLPNRINAALGRALGWPFKRPCPRCGTGISLRQLGRTRAMRSAVFDGARAESVPCSGCGAGLRLSRRRKWLSAALALPVMAASLYLGLEVISWLGLTWIDGLGREQPDAWGAVVLVAGFFALPALVLARIVPVEVVE